MTSASFSCVDQRSDMNFASGKEAVMPEVIQEKSRTLKPEREVQPLDAEFTPSLTWIVFALFVAILLAFAVGGFLQYDSQPIHGVPFRT